MPRPKKNDSNAKTADEKASTPDQAVTRVMGGKERSGPVIGKAQQYQPSTYTTLRGNTREDR